MATGIPTLFVILTWDDYDGWSVEEETDDHTEAVAQTRWYHDHGRTARLVDTREEFFVPPEQTGGGRYSSRGGR